MKKIIRINIIIICFVGIFILLNMLFQPKYMESLQEGSMISEYYNKPHDHQVIFIGDCEVYANFSPMVMYEEEGITSYVRGSSQQLIWQSYYVLKETLKYETPKVVVLNVNSLRYDRNSSEVNEAYNRLMIDKMKWSNVKVELIKDSMTEEETFISYIFPILRYHSRYNQLTGEDIEYMFKKKDNTYQGFLINKNIKPVTNLPTKRILSNYNFSKENINYLDKIRKLCEQNNINLVLIKAPSVYPYWYDEYEEQVKEYANKYNLLYYNLYNMRDDIGIDYDTDTYDGGLHLNLNGAEKNSRYFSKLLKGDISLEDRSGNNYYDSLLIKYKEETK